MDMTRVLLVDDDEALTYSLGRFLEATGRFEIRIENGGTGAVEAAREFRPDLILLDIVMPKVDGTQVAAELSADPVLSATPVVFLTGLVTPGEIKPGQTMGGYPFVPKPVEPEELVEQIDRFVGTTPARGRLRERIEETALLGILNRSLRAQEGCGLCEFRGEIDRAEEHDESGPNWKPPELVCGGGAVPEACRRTADRLLEEAALRYRVNWR